MSDRLKAAGAGAGMTLVARTERAGFYRWLADLFANPPEAATIAAWRSGDLAWAGSGAAVPPGLALVRAAIAGGDDAEAAASRLGIAFGRLFIGLGGPRTVSPYESVHRHGRLAAEPAGTMATLLAERGLAVRHDFPDHLSVELTLLAQMIAAGDAGEQDLVDRLAGWVPGFADGCRREDPTGLWAGAAALLAEELATDAACRPDPINSEERNRS